MKTNGYCYRLHYVPSKDIEVLAPCTYNVTLLGNRVLADDQVRMRSLGWVLIQYSCCPYKKEGHLDTERENTERKKCEDTGDMPSTSQGKSETARNQEKILEQSLPLIPQMEPTLLMP